MDATVIIATRDRIASLERTIDALRNQRTSLAWELIVVDDGSEPPVPERVLHGLPHARLIRGEGRGQAIARNLGLQDPQGEIVVFTDDDTEPAPEWLQSAVDFLNAHPDHAGVEGPVRTLPYDRLYGHSMHAEKGGQYLTANIAFRRAALDWVGGFYEGFPALHCEDVDLAFRVMGEGPIGWAEGMAIVHHPRAQTIRQLARRGRMVSSEVLLVQRHPDRFGRAAKLPPRLFPLLNALAYWRVLGREGIKSPQRALRAAAIALLYMANVILAVLNPRSVRPPGG